MTNLRLIITTVSLLAATTLAADITPINPVNPSGSDPRAVLFNNAFLPFSSAPTTYVQSNTFPTSLSGDYGFFPSDSVSPPAMVVSDPASLTLQSDANVRVYYYTPYTSQQGIPPPTSVNQDSLGFNINSGQVLNPNQQALVFNANGATGANQVTTPGEFVDLGMLSAGTPLNFFLIAQDSAGNSTTYWNDPMANPDFFPHLEMVQFLGTPYYLLAWEDSSLLNEGNLDLFRDLFAVVEVNVAVPEPSTYLLLSGFLLATWCISRRKRNSSASLPSIGQR